MAALTAQKIGELTGLDHRTVRKRLEDAPFRTGPRKARLYESSAVLALQGGEECSAGELRAAKRGEAEERRNKLRLEVESLRRERIPLEQAGEAFGLFCTAVRQIVDRSQLPPAEKKAIFREIQGVIRQW